MTKPVERPELLEMAQTRQEKVEVFLTDYPLLRFSLTDPAINLLYTGL